MVVIYIYLVTYISWWLINYIYMIIYGIISLNATYMVVISQLLGSHALLLSTPGMRNSSTEGLSQRLSVYARPLCFKTRHSSVGFCFRGLLYIYGVIYLYMYRYIVNLYLYIYKRALLYHYNYIYICN